MYYLWSYGSYAEPPACPIVLGPKVGTPIYRVDTACYGCGGGRSCVIDDRVCTCSLLLAFYSCAWYYNEVGACWRGSMLAPTPPETPSDTVQASEAVGNDSDDDLSDRAPLLGASDA